MKRLLDKVIVVTGASSGLGAATAIRLASENALAPEMSDGLEKIEDAYHA